MAYAFSPAGEALLTHLHPDLVRVVRRMMRYQAMDVRVLQTLRSPAEQAKAVRGGFSKTLASKHLPDADGLARAVDLAPWPVDFLDRKRYGILMGLMVAAAAEEQVRIRCGGNWDGDNDFHDNSPEDPGHFELA